jgi:hypothetical protein
MHRVICASLGLAVFAIAQAPSTLPQSAAPEFDCKREFAAFQAAHQGPWIAHWNAATLTPRMIYGAGLPIDGWRENSLDAAAIHAHDALVEHAELLGLGTSEFRQSIGARMGRTWSFKYDQFFRGLQVVGGRADVRVNMSGRIAMLGSTAFPVPADFDTVPGIAQDLATASAWRALEQVPTGVPQPGLERKPRLVIWGDVHAADFAPFSLAWEVPLSNVDRDGNGPIGRYYVDAKSGAVLRFETDKHDCGFLGCNEASHAVTAAVKAPLPAPVPTVVTLMAWTRTGIDGQSALVNVPLPGVVLSVPGIGNVTTDQSGQFTIDIAAPVIVSVGTLDGTHYRPIAGGSTPSASVTVSPGTPATLQLLAASASAEQAAHTTTAYWVDRTNEWSRSILGNSAELATASSILPTVNISSTCNAYYTNNTINFYATGGGCANTAFSTVVAHEWGHGLDERYGGISNATGDGLSEGWGDIIGMYLVDSPSLGSGFQSAGVPLRNGNNTTLYGTQSPVHAAGQVWMGFAWRYRENLRASLGTAQAIQVSNDTVIGSIVADATNQADAVVQVFIADDDDGVLANGTPHYAELSAAAIAKGMPYPQLQVAAISHTPLTNTGFRLESRLVSAQVIAVSPGPITAVRLHYSVNGAPFQIRSMKSDGTADGYRAMLPGLQSGSVNYHIEAEHNGTATVRLPESGEYGYTTSVVATGPFTGFYAEGFDGGAAGWTHGRISATGNDDWQIGAPNGKSSTVSGVSWSDPSAASANGSIWGTDLGAGNSNGRYPNNIVYYLRSPAINCTGQVGTHLRFRRWLTVEEGIYDLAQVYCNGTLIWENQANGHHLDTSWQVVEYPIPTADNNAATVIEFRLTADAGLNLGGWNIDDVELGTRTSTPLGATLQLLPEQAAQGAPVSMQITTQSGTMPFIVAIGDAVGPTSIPGIPLIYVGGNYFTLSAFTDPTGQFTLNFAAPPVTGMQSYLWHSQVLTLDSAGTFVTSNRFTNLFSDTP